MDSTQMSSSTISNVVPLSSTIQSSKKGGASKKTRASSPYKFISRIDGLGQYLRFAFTTKTLEEANTLLADLHSRKVLDGCLCHAYTRKKGEQCEFSIHGIAHVTSRDYQWDFFRKTLPKSFIQVSFYPEGTYPRKNKTIEVIQEGNQNVNNPNPVFSSGSGYVYSPPTNDSSFITFQ